MTVSPVLVVPSPNSHDRIRFSSSISLTVALKLAGFLASALVGRLMAMICGTGLLKFAPTALLASITSVVGVSALSSAPVQPSKM